MKFLLWLAGIFLTIVFTLMEWSLIKKLVEDGIGFHPQSWSVIGWCVIFLIVVSAVGSILVKACLDTD